ncbi:hypothetical protein MEME101129_23975 [Methylobacterium mesophilicum]
MLQSRNATKMFCSIIEYIDCRISLIDADTYCEHLTRNISAAAIFIRTRVGLPIRPDPGSSRGDAPAHGLEPPRRRLRSAHRRAAAAVATAGSRRSVAPGPPVIRPDRRIDSCGDGAAERRPRQRVGTRRVWGGWGRSSGAPGNRRPRPVSGAVRKRGLAVIRAGCGLRGFGPEFVCGGGAAGNRSAAALKRRRPEAGQARRPASSSPPTTKKAQPEGWALRSVEPGNRRGGVYPRADDAA